MTVQLTWPEKVKGLPRTLDRFQAASAFFDLKYPTFLQASIDARKWTSWASLSAIASIPEVIEYDLENLGLLDAWKKSAELIQIRANKTFAILKEIRNYEMHIEYQDRISHSAADIAQIREPIDHDSFFFSPVSWNEFQMLKNIRFGRSIVDQAALMEFNAYARQYSVRTIVDQMLEWLADRVQSFMSGHTQPSPP